MMCARAIFLLNSLLATTCVTGISLKPLSLSEAPTAALDKSPEEAALLADSGSARGPTVGLTDSDAKAKDQNPDEKNAETENNNDGADDNKAADNDADKKDADNKAADDGETQEATNTDSTPAPTEEATNTDSTPAPTEAADDDNKKADDATSTPEPSQESTPTPPGPSADDNNTDDSNQTLMELLDKITPDTIYVGVGQKIQDAYREVSKAVQKFEQLDHFIMGDFEKKLAEIKGHYVRIYNKVQQKVKVIQTEVKNAKNNIQEDPPKYIPPDPHYLNR